MSTDLIVKNEDAIAKMEETVDDCSYEKLKELSPIRRTLVLGAGINQLRQLFTGEILKQFVELANTDLGFRTDRPPGAKDKDGKPLKPYTDEQIRDCVIEAAIRGIQPTQNEFNIISGRCYPTKNFYRRMVRDFEGLTNLRDTYGTPIERGAAALVPCKARWKLNGQEDVIDCSAEGTMIVVRNNKGMTADALLGKAESKLMKRVWGRLTNSKQDSLDAYYGDGDDDDVVEGRVAEQVVEINWDQVEMDLNEGVYADSIQQVNEIGESWAKDCKTEEDKQKVRDLTKAAHDNIKSKRGERSNQPA